MVVVVVHMKSVHTPTHTCFSFLKHVEQLSVFEKLGWALLCGGVVFAEPFATELFCNPSPNWQTLQK